MKTRNIIRILQTVAFNPNRTPYYLSPLYATITSTHEVRCIYKQIKLHADVNLKPHSEPNTNILHPLLSLAECILLCERNKSIWHTSPWSSRIISYMSRSTNNFSGDLLLLAIASPKLSRVATLLAVTSAKHCSLRLLSTSSKISSQIFLSPANSSLTWFKHNQMTEENNYKQEANII